MKPLPPAEDTPSEKVCRFSFWHILMLDNPVRRFFQNPEKILDGRIQPGMTAIDIGCGPGNFTRAMAAMAGEGGRVLAIDLQEEMLRYAQDKCGKDSSGARITWHQCRPDSLGISIKADFALSMYMVHEVPDQERLYHEIFQCLRSGGKYLVVEPIIHVTEEAFTSSLDVATRAGFRIRERPSFPLSQAVVLEKP
ncbi:MAG: class I SAM-dependent methyltransferase [Methanoregula sp.]